MSRLCPNGHEVNDNLRFCPKCGAELKDNGTRFCKKCGTERKGTEKFCSKCGNSFEGVPTPQPISQPTPSYDAPETSTDYKTIIIPIVIGLVILALIGGGWYGYKEYSAYNEKKQAREKFVADSLEKARKDSLRRIELAEQQRADSLFRQESKHFVESFYTVLLKRNGNDKIIEQSITLHAKKILIQLYRDCWGGDENFMATWVFTKEYHDSPISDVYSFRVSEQEKGQYLVSIRYEYNETEYSEYDVLLTIVKEENTYKIDNVEKKRVFYNMKTSEDEDYYG